MEIGNFGRKTSPEWTEEDPSGSALDFEEGILRILDELFVYGGLFDETIRKISPDGDEEWVFDGFTDNVWGVAVDPGTLGAFPEEY